MEEIFKKIARENNTTEKQVEEDILYALNIAIEKSKEDKNARNFERKQYGPYHSTDCGRT